MINHREIYFEEATEHYKTRLRLHETLDALRNLMAVINRDGGQTADSFLSYTEAAEACERKVLEMMSEISFLKQEIKNLSKAGRP